MTSEELYNNYIDFIRSIAVKVATEFGCRNHSEYLRELCSEGAVVFFSLLHKNQYDETKGAFTTYLYPHLHGAMVRFMKKEAGYSEHIISVDDFAGEEFDGDPYEIFEDDSVEPPHRIVYRKICVELLGELFDTLTVKEKMILGQFYGVYGYEKKTLDDIAFEQVMKNDGVSKARDQALNRLRDMVDGSKLQQFRWAYRVVMEGKKRELSQ